MKLFNKVAEKVKNGIIFKLLSSNTQLNRYKNLLPKGYSILKEEQDYDQYNLPYSVHIFEYKTENTRIHLTDDEIQGLNIEAYFNCAAETRLRRVREMASKFGLVEDTGPCEVGDG